MAAGPENRFLRAVNQHLAGKVHCEKMHNPYRGGTFDMWYSGKRADMWIEYKWIPRVPKSGTIVPSLSELQRKWGVGRLEESRKVYVVVGCPDGGVIFATPTEWEAGLSAEAFRKELLTKRGLASWIANLTTGEALNDGDGDARPRRQRRRVRVQDPNHRVSDL